MEKFNGAIRLTERRVNIKEVFLLSAISLPLFS
jgi:hypothetical protein